MIPAMPSRERRMDLAGRMLQRQLDDLGDDYRQARLRAGLTLASVGAAIRVSPSTVLRHEQGLLRGADLGVLARQGAAVGLRLTIKAYPAGPPLRDAPQLALIRRFQERVSPGGWRWRFEVELRIARDRRALDGTMSRPDCVCGVEFFTRFHDCQAQLRAVHLKQRDAGMDRMIVVVAATPRNREGLRAASHVAGADFPLGTRAVLHALQLGRDPGANGIVLI